MFYVDFLRNVIWGCLPRITYDQSIARGLAYKEKRNPFALGKGARQDANKQIPQPPLPTVIGPPNRPQTMAKTMLCRQGNALPHVYPTIDLWLKKNLSGTF